MYSDVDHRVRGIREGSPLIEGQAAVGIAKAESRDSARFQFLTKATRKRQRHILFQQLGPDRDAWVIATVAGVNYCVEMSRRQGGSRGHGRWRRGIDRRRRWGSSRSSG